MIEATSAPEIAFAVKSPLAKYIVICLDPDGPFPSFNVLSPILHWIQSDFKVAASTDTLTTTEPFIANYIGPGPPPGSFPHRYVFLLYEQPSDFNSRDHAPPGGKPFGTWARMRWDLPAWEKRAKLDRPVAVGYFTSN
jgi:phosphatidylethanolamine-binding protein